MLETSPSETRKGDKQKIVWDQNPPFPFNANICIRCSGLCEDTSRFAHVKTILFELVRRKSLGQTEKVYFRARDSYKYVLESVHWRIWSGRFVRAGHRAFHPHPQSFVALGQVCFLHHVKTSQRWEIGRLCSQGFLIPDTNPGSVADMTTARSVSQQEAVRPHHGIMSEKWSSVSTL